MALGAARGLLLIGDMKKHLYAQIKDPSGHPRSLRWSEFPFVLGTDLLDRSQLRDPKIRPQALKIERHPNRDWVMSALDPELTIRVGDFKARNLDLPLHVPILIGDTEITFSEGETRLPLHEFPSGERPWLTESEAGLKLLGALRKSSSTRLSIYLNGETGTGKEVLARLIHLWSDRASGAYVALNCGGFALSLAESELFGHVKGAFTGAVRDRPGALLQAHGGTLFLDEVGDLPPELQVKLLRFLESGEIRPVGSDRVLHADVRVVCATHKPLHSLVKEGRFRQDLFYRLASIPVEIPPLRSRPEDIRLLSVRFASEFEKSLTQEAITRLQVNAWPGNVRELRHAVERACGGAGPFESVIHASDFDFLSEDRIREGSIEGELTGVMALKDMEKIMILRALKHAEGNRTDAARILGIARSTLFEMMKRHEIVGPRSSDFWVSHLMGASS